MTKPKKPSHANTKSAELFRLALERAKTALQDEHTRKMLVANGKAIAAQVQQLWIDRKLDSVTNVEPVWLSAKFGQGKLERRVAYLASMINSLSSGRPELTEAPAPVREAVIQIRTSIEIAGGLPFVKRKQAHHRLDKTIDRLEEMIFEASLPSTQ